MFEPLIEVFVGAAIDQVVASGVGAFARAAQRTAGEAHGANQSNVVHDLVRGILDGRPRSELLSRAEQSGLSSLEAGPLVETLLVDCRRRVEERLFRWATSFAALLWFGPALMLVWTMLGFLAHGSDGLEQAAQSLDSTIFFAVVGLAVAVGFFGAKALFPKWYAIHKALRQNDAAIPDRVVTQRLATDLGPIGGHLWFLGHEGYSARSGPLRLLAAVLLAPYGLTAWSSWRTARALRGMSDDQFTAWAYGVAPRAKPRPNLATKP